MLNLTNSINPHSAAYLFLSKENPGRVPGLGTVAGLAQDEKPRVRGRDAGEGGGLELEYGPTGTISPSLVPHLQ